MFQIRTDVEKNRLYLSLHGHLNSNLLKEATAAVMQAREQLGHGFDMVSDMQEAFPTDEAGVQDLIHLQLYLRTSGMRHLVRVSKRLLTELQFERASKHSGIQAIVVKNLENADNLLDCSLDDRACGPMRNWTQVRQYRRIPVGAEFTVRFSIRGLELYQIRMRDLSAQGCCLMLREEFASLIHEGALLKDFRFEHSDLPDTPVTAKVVRVQLGLREIADSPIGLGIQFLTASSHFKQWVDAYVVAYYGLCE